MPSSHGDGRGLSTVGGGKRATSQSKTVAITLVISGEVRQGYWRDESCPAVSKRSPESIEKWLKFRIFVLLPLISKTGFFFRVFFLSLFPFGWAEALVDDGDGLICSLAGVLCGSPAFYVGHGQLLPANRNTPSPIDPDTIQVPVGYEPDPADLALSSIPGQEMFDPRKRKFSEEELKPQPMIKKARKVFIPDDLKDDKYWARRRKNNMAAKRSRDARRLKENQIAIRASFLEKENSALRQEVADLRKELGKCKNILAKYEARHGPL
ncbi:hepatic leukemia factor isoform X3 [Bos indicus]|uniref:HLF transcription factor, PAR bZIP family member n=3 Tax=Bos TaxID=9903 RepID=A0A4W2H1Q7_BOBOX|nr:hepatic leukemia factor isoform X3 [Bos indicus x Bos taurus]